MLHRGAQMAEIIPAELDPDNTGVRIASSQLFGPSQKGSIMNTEISKKEKSELVYGNLQSWQGRKEWFFNRQYTDPYENYYEGKYKRAEQEQKHVMKNLIKTDQRVQNLLEFGCGTTRFTRWWHEIGLEATGADISPFMLSQALHRWGGDLVMADSHHMPFKNDSYDALVFMNTFEYYREPKKVILEAARVAKYGFAMGMMNKLTPKFIRRRVQQAFGANEYYRTATFYTPKTLFKLIEEALHNRAYELSWNCTGLPNWFPVKEWKMPYGDFFGVYVKFKDNNEI